MCHGLNSCVRLDLAHTRVSDAGLQTLLDKVLHSPLRMPVRLPPRMEGTRKGTGSTDDVMSSDPVAYQRHLQCCMYMYFSTML